MASSRDEGPVYYREIQKNAYLKRIPNEVSGGSKLRPLSSKKVPLKSMWTQLCVHNGRTPYLEQYPDAESPATVCHAPVWRACLRSARHVTASVKPHTGDQYDFLVDTDNGAVRMLAPDWETMQDWVTTLRNTLHELKIMGKGENVYCAAPAPPAPRAAARDPTSPLPPTPPIPPDRVPGIELIPNIRPTQPESAIRPNEPANRTNDPTSRPNDSSIRPSEPTSRSNDSNIRSNDSNIRPNEPNSRPTDSNIRSNEPNSRTIDSISAISSLEPIENNTEDIDISNWDTPFSSLPSTSQPPTGKRGVTKICGQNICLDDSLFKRSTTDSDEEFFAEIDKLELDDNDYKQTVIISNEEKANNTTENSNLTTNITVIQVSNKEPPHTAIPILGPETDVFDFEFKQKFVNIVNTEENAYGTTFDKNDSEYGHLSLTTTVNLTGERTTEPHFDTNEQNTTKTEGLYERLCMASTSTSTSNSKPSPLPVKKLKNIDKTRKSSLPNLEIGDSTYEYLFLSNNNSSNMNHASSSVNHGNNVNHSTTSLNQSSNSVNNASSSMHQSSNSVNHANSSINQISHIVNQPINSLNHASSSVHQSNNSVNHGSSSVNQGSHIVNSMSHASNSVNHATTTLNHAINSVNHATTTNHSNISNSNEINCNDSIQLTSQSEPMSRITTVERSRSQNAFDITQGTRDNVRRAQNNSPKREIKNQTSETQAQTKPIWKRGLTELSLLSLTRLRSIKQNKKRDSPTRNGTENQQDRPVGVTSPVKVVHRSRADHRVDTSRRRSSSLSNGQAPGPVSLTPLRARQAASLQAEQRRGAALAATIPVREAPVFAHYDKQVWIAWWNSAGARLCGRVGDRVVAIRGVAPTNVTHARQLLGRGASVDILFHRVPLGKIYVINKRDQESLGVKLDNECNIVSVEGGSPCARAGLPPPGSWALTEINNRPLNLLKGGDEEMKRLSKHGTEVSMLIQPTALVKKLRAALKGNKNLLGLR